MVSREISWPGVEKCRLFCQANLSMTKQECNEGLNPQSVQLAVPFSDCDGQRSEFAKFSDEKINRLTLHHHHPSRSGHLLDMFSVVPGSNPPPRL